MEHTYRKIFTGASILVLTTLGAAELQIDAAVDKPNLLTKTASGTSAAVVSDCAASETDQWKAGSHTFVTGRNGGTVTLRFRAKWTPDRRIHGIWFRRIALNAEPITPQLPAGSRSLARLFQTADSGETLLFATYKDFGSYTFSAKPDTTYTVTFQHRDGGLAVPASDVCCLDLSSALNRTYADPSAKEGWTGQGPRTDMGGFDVQRISFGGMEFRLKDRCAVFNSTYVPTTLKSFTANGKNFPAKYLYLLHTAAWNRADTVAGKIKVNYADGSHSDFEVVGGKDVDDWSQLIHLPNARPAYVHRESEGKGVLYLSAFPLQEKPVKNIEFSSPENFVWIIAGATLSTRQVPIAPEKKEFRATAPAWKEPDFPSPVVVENSVLDLSGKGNVSPAGSDGRVIAVPGKGFRFEKKPDVPVRFMGMADTPFYLRTAGDVTDMHGKLARTAEAASRQGYNLVRLWVDQHLMGRSTQKGIPDPRRVEAFDFYLSELKKRGIYVTFAIAFFRVGAVDHVKDPVTGQVKRDIKLLVAAEKARNTRKLLTLFGEEKARAEWKAWAETMLNHVNPYTGLAWKDDPMIVFLELFNEQTLAIPHLFWGESCDIAPEAMEFIRKKFCAFLEKKYGTVASLNQAWQKQYASFSRIRLPDFLRKDQIGADWEEFCFEAIDENYRTGTAILRNLGYKGLIGQYNFRATLNMSRFRRDHLAMIIRNTYYKHPSRWDSIGSRVGQESAIREYAPHFRNTAASRIAGLPLVITEHNHCFWNRYQHENGLLFSAYPAFQGWDALCAHETPVVIEPGEMYISSFRIAGSPVLRANEFLAYALFKRGDVRPAETEFLLDLGKFDANDADLAVDSEVSKLALLSRLGVYSPHAAIRPNSRLLQVKGGSEDRSFDWHSEVVDGGSSFSLAGAIAGMEKKGKAPEIRQGVLIRDTGELELDPIHRRFRVKTPRTEGAVVNAGEPATRLPRLTIKKSSVDAAIALVSMDGRELSSSKRMVLVCNTAVMTRDTVLSRDRTTLLGWKRRSKVLLETGAFDIAIRRKGVARATCYPLSVNGIRRDGIPMRREGEYLTVNLDTAALKHGPTPFFEIVVE